MRNVVYIFLLALILIGNGCASITRGTKDVLIIQSEPVGASVKLSNGMSGKTPASFKLSRKDNLIVTIEKDGYETVTVQVTPQIVGAGGAGMAGNLFVGGIIGALVDVGTGAMMDLKPNPISVKLVPLAGRVFPSSAPADRPKDSIAARLMRLKSLRDQGKITEDEYRDLRRRILQEI